MKGGEATLHERVSWCRDVAKVLGWVHEKNVRHADLSGRNLLIDSKRKILRYPLNQREVLLLVIKVGIMVYDYSRC